MTHMVDTPPGSPASRSSMRGQVRPRDASDAAEGMPPAQRARLGDASPPAVHAPGLAGAAQAIAGAQPGPELPHRAGAWVPPGLARMPMPVVTSLGVPSGLARIPMPVFTSLGMPSGPQIPPPVSTPQPNPAPAPRTAAQPHPPAPTAMQGRHEPPDAPRAPHLVDPNLRSYARGKVHYISSIWQALFYPQGPHGPFCQPKGLYAIAPHVGPPGVDGKPTGHDGVPMELLARLVIGEPTQDDDRNLFTTGLQSGETRYFDRRHAALPASLIDQRSNRLRSTSEPYRYPFGLEEFMNEVCDHRVWGEFENVVMAIARSRHTLGNKDVCDELFIATIANVVRVVALRFLEDEAARRSTSRPAGEGVLRDRLVTRLRSVHVGNPFDSRYGLDLCLDAAGEMIHHQARIAIIAEILTKGSQQMCGFFDREPSTPGYVLAQHIMNGEDAELSEPFLREAFDSDPVLAESLCDPMTLSRIGSKISLTRDRILNFYEILALSPMPSDFGSYARHAYQMEFQATVIQLAERLRAIEVDPLQVPRSHPLQVRSYVTAILKTCVAAYAETVDLVEDFDDKSGDEDASEIDGKWVTGMPALAALQSYLRADLHPRFDVHARITLESLRLACDPTASYDESFPKGTTLHKYASRLMEFAEVFVPEDATIKAKIKERYPRSAV
jgi:hypothetical protein